MSQILEVKSILNLVNKKFYIPDYQRGYRWGKTQVLALLKDITENPLNHKYCLQPIVVSKIKDGQWELLDGQQRLTTIYILIQYIKLECCPKIESFFLEFETRTKSEDFLEHIGKIDRVKTTNIDFYYMSSAMITIREWFKNYDNPKNKIDEFSRKLLNDIQILWYDIGEKLPKPKRIDIFKRLNMGKIPLTSAELVRATFLNEKNFSEDGKPDKFLKIKQHEMATEWDQIENSLHNEAFWYFICKEDELYQTRIDLLFELLFEKSKKSDPLWVFLEIQKELTEVENKIVYIENQWKEIKHKFMVLREWYSDHTLYHYIGFLITAGINLKTIFLEYAQRGKGDFLKYITLEIENIVKNITKDIDIDELDFHKHYDSIKIILLLHNIQTIVSKKADIFFSFKQYHCGKWSLEHIHARNSESLNTEKQWREWLEYHSEYLTGEQIPQKITKDKFIELQEIVVSRYLESQGEQNNDLEIDNSIANLALLQTKDNAALNNSIFPIKRNKIIELDKKGQFIPICTKNAFLKYYNKNTEQSLSFWSDEDKRAYVEDIRHTIEQINKYSGESHEY